MAKVFLDANIIIDILEKREKAPLTEIDSHETYISPFTLHIFFYVEKQKVPYMLMSEFLTHNNIVDFSDNVVRKSLIGPTDDFEDNVQLHSAAEAECGFFITADKKLLDMKFFGKTQIISSEELK